MTSTPRRAKPEKRAYSLGLRAEQATLRRERILDVAHRMFRERSCYEDVTFEAVASEAEVALKTVVRNFGTKEALLLESVRRNAPREAAERAVTPGDVRGVARALARRYEALAPMTVRAITLEDRLPAIAEVLAIARASHRAWLAEAFAPSLPPRSPKLKERRLAQLFAATEIYVWHVWRNRLGMSAEAAESAMGDTLEALVTHWNDRGRL